MFQLLLTTLAAVVAITDGFNCAFDSNIHVTENDVDGTFVAQLNCAGTGLLYSIKENEGSQLQVPFDVDDYGRITVAYFSPDYEENDSITFTCIVYQPSDTSRTTEVTQELTLTAIIDPVNEFAPKFIQDVWNISVEEKDTNMFIFKVSASDEDSGDDGVVMYYLEDDPANGGFGVYKKNGMLYTTKGLDRESKSQYVMTIFARDNASDSYRLRSNTTVIINVIDINDNQPKCSCPSPWPSFLDLFEDEHVATVKCTDSDTGENANLNYEIYAVETDVQSNYSFWISDEGVIVNKSPIKYVINYNRYNVYNITVKVSDNGTIPLTTDCIVQVVIEMAIEGQCTILCKNGGICVANSGSTPIQYACDCSQTQFIGELCEMPKASTSNDVHTVMKRAASRTSDSASSDSSSSEATRQPVTERGEESHANKTETTTEQNAGAERPGDVRLSDDEARTPTRNPDKLTTSTVADKATTNVVPTTEVTALESTTQLEQKTTGDTQSMTRSSTQSENDETTNSPTTLDVSKQRKAMAVEKLRILNATVSGNIVAEAEVVLVLSDLEAIIQQKELLNPTLQTAELAKNIESFLGVMSKLLEKDVKWTQLVPAENAVTRFTDLIENFMEDAMLLADEIQFSSPTLNMRSERINTDADDIIDVATDPAGNGEHVQIPRSLVKRGSDTRVSIASYNNTALAMPDNKTEMGSKVFSILLRPLPNETFVDPVEIVFPIASKPNGTKSVCYFLEKTNKKSWSTFGCELGRETPGYVTCKCTHLTNFAVLMQVVEIQLPAGVIASLEIITMIGTSLSLVSELATFVALVTLRLFSDRMLLLLNLVFALVVSQSVFLGGIEATYNTTICTSVAVMLHYFYLAMFTLMLAEGIQLYQKLYRTFQEGIKVVYLILLAWGIPAVIVIVSTSLNIEGYGSQDRCWLSLDTGLIWAFVGPALTVISVNIIILILVIRVFLTVRITAKKTDIEKIGSSIKATVVLLPLIGVTWLFGVLTMNSQTIVFQYFFAILNSVQGFFVFLFHIVLNDEVRTAFRKKQGKVSFVAFQNPATTSSSIKGSNASSRSHKKKRLTRIMSESTTSSTDYNVNAIPHTVHNGKVVPAFVYKEPATVSG